jgi:hypothetical protein
MAAAGLAALIAAGLWISLHYCLVAWKADPDIFVAVELWRGVQRHGLTFLASWTYTQDNWLLSLLPIAALSYEAFGANARATVLVGWLVFLACVALTGAIVARVTGRTAGAIVAGVLLFANYHALGHIGFLGYPISHGVSMAWGLVALLLAHESLERLGFGAALAAAAVVFIDCLSDPWAAPAIAIPLVLVSGAIAAANPASRLRPVAGVLCVACAVAFWAAHRHPFGLFRFLPRSHFELGGEAAMRTNLGLAVRALGVMFHIVPGASYESLAARSISLAALAGLVGASVVGLLAGLRGAGAGRQLVVGVASLSIAAIGVLYLAGPANSDLYVGRFFPNLYFLGAALVALAWPAWPRPAKTAVALYAALFVLAGAVSVPAFWRAPLEASEPTEPLKLAAFLQARGLAYGYGPYWGASALAMDGLTNGAVTIRPVTFKPGHVAPRPVGASRRWFAPGAEPAGRPVFLAILPDGEECPSVAACEAAAQRQFGAPAARLPYGEGVVLVWRRALAPLISD